MPANFSPNARHARLNACLNATGTATGASVNGQTAGGGQLVIGTSSLAPGFSTPASATANVLATVALLANPPFTLADNPAATPPNTVATLAGVSYTATPSASGTASLAEFRDSSNYTVVSGLTVGLAGSGADVIVSTLTFSTSVAVTVTAATITTQ